MNRLALKNVLQLDVNGKLLGYTLAQEDPDNPGSFLLPLNAIDVELPENMRDEYDYYYYDNKWHAEQKPVVKEEKQEREYPELSTLEYAKVYRSHLLETATVFVDDMEFDTDEDSLTSLTQAVEYGTGNLDWVLHDKTVTNVNIDILKQVLAKGIAYKTQLWSKVYTDQEKMAQLGKQYLEQLMMEKNNAD